MFNELIEAGRSLLRAQPMEKDDYFRWSDDARVKIADCYGSKAPKTLEFHRARREISTTMDTDPSYYLTQVGANLRRELRILEKFRQQEDNTSGSQPASPPATATPQRDSAKGRLLILQGTATEYSQDVGRVVGELGFSPTEVAAKDRQAVGALRAALTAPDLAGALLFVDRDPTSRGAKGRPKIESVLELGILLGILGPEKVIALIAPKVAMPTLTDQTRQIPLEDAASLKKALESFLAR